MGKTLSVKVQNGKGVEASYKNSVDISNPKLVGLVLSDLELHGCPIKKSFEFFNKEREKIFPW